MSSRWLEIAAQCLQIVCGYFVVVLSHPIVARTNDLIEMNFIALIPCYLYYFSASL